MQRQINDFKDPRKTHGCGKILTIWGPLGQEEIKEKKTKSDLASVKTAGLRDMVGCMEVNGSSDFSETTFLLLYLIIIDS